MKKRNNFKKLPAYPLDTEKLKKITLSEKDGKVSVDFQTMKEILTMMNEAYCHGVADGMSMRNDSDDE